MTSDGRPATGARVRLLCVGAAVLLAPACSSGSPAPAPTTPSVSAGTTTSAPAPPAPAPPACPQGAYVLSALEGRGAASSLGHGSGGGIAVTFTDGTFTFSSDGTRPMSLDVGPTKAELRLDGRITGTYEDAAPDLRMTATGAEGEVSVKGFGFTRSRSAGAVADQLVGQGTTAQVACDDAAGTAVVTLPNASLALARV